MKGTVMMINQETRMVALENENGEYAVFELTDGSNIEIGNKISGNLKALGVETIRNETQMKDMKVCVEAIYATQETAKQLV